MAAPYFYDTSANVTPANKEHLLTDLLDAIQSVLSEGIHPYCEEDPLGLNRFDVSRSSLGYVRQTETITCVSVRIVANRDSIYRTNAERDEAKADLEHIAEDVAKRYESRSFVACNTSWPSADKMPSAEPEQGHPRSLRSVSCGPMIGVRNSRMGSTPTKSSALLSAKTFLTEKTTSTCSALRATAP